jgi:hypothetical protein
MSGRELTSGDLVRALGSLTARPAVDAAVRTRAEMLAERIEARAGGEVADVRVVRRGPAAYAVEVSAPNLFGREFGSLDKPADPLIGAAVAELEQ